MKIVINPNKDIVADIRNRLKENNGYCPCALIKTEETKCPCKEFIESYPSGSYCHCGLYIKQEG